eukprot:TRINITY_DN1188_c0_g1_i2.p1 TRINITY_DN1188_c0_g1~~TRINITY_DN1188_c0_g1_i2.p1  ORF type:complete len:429 (-),score=175.32 TRINITY_DN1188_c0_g1_i2:268-1554(-)
MATPTKKTIPSLDTKALQTEVTVTRVSSDLGRSYSAGGLTKSLNLSNSENSKTPLATERKKGFFSSLFGKKREKKTPRPEASGGSGTESPLEMLLSPRSPEQKVVEKVLKYVVAQRFEDLPEEIVKEFTEAKIDLNKAILTENWKSICSILTFLCDCKIFLTEESKQAYLLEKDKPEDPAVTFSDIGISFVEAERSFLLPETRANVKKQYKYFTEVGKGSFGTVFSATSILDKKKDVAIKIVKHVTDEQKKTNLCEIKVLNSCKHTNIVHFYRAHLVENEVWIVMEWMQGGTLHTALASHSFTETEISTISREVLKGIAILHKNKICHRDLKSYNIMMTVDGDIKLIDFGLSCDVTNDRFSICGSPYWLAPEMINGSGYGVPADIWSFGITLLELANGCLPHSDSAIKVKYDFKIFQFKIIIIITITF